MRYIIYLATNNVNHKKYIGFTSQPLSRRRTQHISTAKATGNNKFHNAIRKYGFDVFTWEVVYESWDRVHCLEFAENSIIENYDSIDNGYNSRKGGSAPKEYKKSTKCGKTLSEQYGAEKAKQIRNKISSSVKLAHIRGDLNYKGPTHYKFDNTIYKFWNRVTNEKFCGSRHDFMREFDFAKSPINRMINGNKTSYQNWVMDKGAESYKLKLFEDPIIYTFEHENGSVFVGRRKAFYDKYSLCDSSVGNMVRGKRNSVSGWKLISLYNPV